MPRGKNYWEMTYDPAGENPAVSKRIDELENVAGFENAKVDLTCGGDTKKSINLVKKRFSICDFKGGLEKASFTNCDFTSCYFGGTHWNIVKFTKCTFRECHFLHTDFNDCRFIDCEFYEISIGVEHFRVGSTDIDVTKFLAAVTTNLRYLPATTTAEYQKSRLKRDKAKVARILYRSNQDLFGRQYFAAHKQLVVSTLLAEIEERRFLEPRHKNTMPCPRNKVSFFLRTGMLYTELALVYVAGGLTDWGQSLTRALIFIFVVTSSFVFIYSKWFTMTVYDGLVRSIDVSLVAGYTAHIDPKASHTLTILTLVNLFFGLYWYSLVVPVVTRKFLR